MRWGIVLLGLALLPMLAILIGASLFVLSAFWPKGVLMHECASCGRSGKWTRRSSLGYHLCESCAGPSSPAHPERLVL